MSGEVSAVTGGAFRRSPGKKVGQFFLSPKGVRSGIGDHGEKKVGRRKTDGSASFYFFHAGRTHVTH